MCLPATHEQAHAFAEEIGRLLPADVRRAYVVRTGRENPWFPGTDVEVHVEPAGDPGLLHERLAALVTERMWSQDVWFEVRVAAAAARADRAPVGQPTLQV